MLALQYHCTGSGTGGYGHGTMYTRPSPEQRAEHSAQISSCPLALMVMSATNCWLDRYLIKEKRQRQSITVMGKQGGNCRKGEQASSLHGTWLGFSFWFHFEKSSSPCLRSCFHLKLKLFFLNLCLSSETYFCLFSFSFLKLLV